MSLHPPPSARANPTPASLPAPRLVSSDTAPTCPNRGGSAAPDRTVAGGLAGVQGLGPMGVGSRKWFSQLAKSSNFAYCLDISLMNPYMVHVEKISVELTHELGLIMKKAVGSGAYASSIELMREALREWRERREYRAKASERLGQLWDVGLASGEPVDGSSAMLQIKAKLCRASTNA